MSTNIAGKVVVITGASSGLGEATARLLSGEGATVVLGAQARRPHPGSRRRAQREGRDRTGRADRRHRPRPGRGPGRRRRRGLRARRRHGQQRRPHAALPARAPQGRGVGADDRRQHQGRALRDRGGAAAHDAPEGRPLHQRLLGRRSQGRRRAAPSTRPPSTRCARSRRACARRSSPTTSAPPWSRRALSRPSCPTASARRTSRRASTGSTTSIAVPADSFARVVAFAMSQPDDVDINEVLYRPTSQVL